MINAFFKAWAQVPSGPFLRVFLLGSVAALAVLTGLWWLTDGWLSSYAGLPPGNWWGRTLGWLADHGAVGLTLLATWLLFPAVSTTVMGILLDDVVDAVEAVHYPAAKAPRPMGLSEGAWLGLKSGLRFLGVNLLLSPVYIVLLFTAIGPFILFLLVNGYMLGRDYMQMVSVRHLGKQGDEAFRRANKAMTFGLGVATSLLFLVPVVNLFAPLVGAAMATHLFHGGRRAAP
jgi:CysZ protein